MSNNDIYTAAIEKLRELHEKWSSAGNRAAKEIEEAFPELTESEDEKIRKELLAWLKSRDWQTLPIDRYNAAIAWLEKQGETFTKKDIDDTYLKGVCDAKHELGKQGEQKPWSKEDENHVKSILSTIECCKVQFPNAQAVVEAYNADVDWLKSLKDRVLPQPKQEWSEEDKDKLNRIYSILGQAADTHAFSTTCRLIGDRECIELQDFLKSIRPHSQWRPSDEQLKMLDKIIDVLDSTQLFGGRNALIELKHDLKKLRED